MNGEADEDFARTIRGLMDRVDWVDLGFQEGVEATAKSKHPIPDKPVALPIESDDDRRQV